MLTSSIIEVKENDVLAPVPDTGTWQVGSLNTATRCFDLLCTGNCEFGSSDQKLKLDVIPADKIPDFFTKNSNGDIVFAEPKPVCTIRTPRGHGTAIEIELKTVTGEYFDIAKYVCLGIRRKNSCEYLNILSAPKNAEGNPSGGFEISDNSEVELIPLISNTDLSKSNYESVTVGGVISKSDVPFPANEFDFGSVYRIKVMDLTVTWLENQECDLQKLDTGGLYKWGNIGHLGIGKVNGKNNQLVSVYMYTGQLAYSADGNTWTKWGEPLGSDGWWTGPAYGNSTWCIVNWNRKDVRYRKDEDESWSTVSSIELPIAVALNYNSDIFMLIGADNNVYTSQNAENWKLVGNIPNKNKGSLLGQIRILTYGCGIWVCGTADGEVFRSADNTGAGTWISLGSSLNKISHNLWHGGCFAHGYFYVVNESNCNIARSSDGIIWTEVGQLSSVGGSQNITFFNGKLYVFGREGTHYHIGSFPE